MKAGGYLKGLVALVGGSTSGFSAVIGAYVTTITTTIIVVVICAALAVCMYCARVDQRLRMDARYGGENPMETLPWPVAALYGRCARTARACTSACAKCALWGGKTPFKTLTAQ